MHTPTATISAQVSKIATAVQDVLTRGPSWCVTFESAASSDIWVQFNADMVNAAYPYADDPLRRLSTLKASELISWTPTKYVTVAMKSTDAYAIAIWIDHYFRDVLRCSDSYRVESKIENLDA